MQSGLDSSAALAELDATCGACRVVSLDSTGCWRRRRARELLERNIGAVGSTDYASVTPGHKWECRGRLRQLPRGPICRPAIWQPFSDFTSVCPENCEFHLHSQNGTTGNGAERSHRAATARCGALCQLAGCQAATWCGRAGRMAAAALVGCACMRAVAPSDFTSVTLVKSN